MAIDPNVFDKLKTFEYYSQAQQAFELQQQLVAQKMLAAQRGDELPAAIQVANEYKKRLDAGDVAGANQILMFAKASDKGIVTDANGAYQKAPGYAEALGGIEYGKRSGQNQSDLQYKPAIAGAEQQAKKNVDIRTNPIIAEGEAEARLRKELEYAPRIDVAKKDAEGAANDSTVNPLIQQLRDYNALSFEMPYSGAALPFTRLSPDKATQDKVTNTDLLLQARTDMAAPLAKQLGVNPTDKDFQASLDRIFNINSTQQSRAAQIDALEQRIKQRKAARATRQGVNSIDDVLKNYQKPADIDTAQALFDARKAIKSGKDPEAVKKRLRDHGIDPAGL